MTLSNQKTKSVYCGNGITTCWGLDFPVQNPAHVAVYLTSPAGEETRIFGSFNVDLAEQCVVYPTSESELPPLADGWKITLVRQTPHTQELDLVQQGVFDAEALEAGLDKTAMQIQELAEQVSRAVKFGVSGDALSATDAQSYLAQMQQAKESAVSQVENLTENALQQVDTALSVAQEAQNLAQQSVSSAQSAAQIAQQASQSAQQVLADLDGYVQQASAAQAGAQTACQQAQAAGVQAQQTADSIADDVQTVAANAGSAQSAALAAQQSSMSAQADAQTAQESASSAEQAAEAAQSAAAAVQGFTQQAQTAADNAQSWAHISRGFAVGTVYVSQFSSAVQNPGALPLFTGETISDAQEIYPDFYALIAADESLQCTAEEYEEALETGGKCDKYVVEEGSLRLPFMQFGDAHYPWVMAFNHAVEVSVAQASAFQQALSAKADVSLSNTAPSHSFKEAAVGWGMPDYAAVTNLTTPFTADRNYLCFMRNNTEQGFIVYIDGQEIANFSPAGGYVPNIGQTFLLPKGSTVTMEGYAGIKVKFPLIGG